jgi:UDP-N-acetylmuramate--alanine ligase
MTALLDADVLYVMDIYPASEKPIEGVTGRALAEGIKARGHKAVRFLPDRQAVAEEVAKDLQEGDMLITLGAGDVTRLGPEIVEALRKREQDRT